MKELSRWPLLLATVTLLAAALAVDWSASESVVGFACLALAAVCLGGFLYAEGARHREWWSRTMDDESEEDKT